MVLSEISHIIVQQFNKIVDFLFIVLINQSTLFNFDIEKKLQCLPFQGLKTLILMAVELHHLYKKHTKKYRTQFYTVLCKLTYTVIFTCWYRS